MFNWFSKSKEEVLEESYPDVFEMTDAMIWDVVNGYYPFPHLLRQHYNYMRRLFGLPIVTKDEADFVNVYIATSWFEARCKEIAVERGWK